VRYLLLMLVALSGCATSSYKQGCLDALDEEFTGPWTDWQEPFCEKLDQQHLKKLEEQEARDREYRGRGL
jgi:hypothetical protein